MVPPTSHFPTHIRIVETYNIYKDFIAKPQSFMFRNKCLAVFIALQYTANIFLAEANESIFYYLFTTVYFD